MNIKDILNNKEDLIAGKGASDLAISNAEKELNLFFATEYKEYLEVFGLIMCNGHELTGIGNIERMNVVTVTKEMKELYSNIPNDWYVIEDTNLDNIVIWQARDGRIYYNKQEMFQSFSDFLQAI